MFKNKVQWIKERPYLCAAPYNKYDFRIRHVGFSVSCCCNLDVGYSEKSSTTELVDEVRAAMDQKQTHPACWRCHEEEARGHISERIRSLVGRADRDIYELDQGTLVHPEFEVGMRFSNLCNLGCRSCNPQDSSTFSKITGLAPELPEMAEDQSDVPEHWNIIIDTIEKKYQSIGDNQLILHPIGGETVLQPGVYKLLDWAIESGIAPDIVLRITTSFATPISDVLMSKLQQFKQVMLLNSIDSVGDNYHHVRWPAKFEKVERNLDMFIEIHRKDPEKFPLLGVLPTFSLNNIFYMPEILDFWNHWFESNNIPGVILTTHLYTPTFLSFDILPVAYRDKLAKLLEPYQTHAIFDNPKNHVRSLYEYISATLDILKDAGDSNEDKFCDYLKFSADYDRRTGSNSFHGNRKLFDLLSPQHVEIYQQYYDSANISIPIYYKNSEDSQDDPI